MMWENEMRVKCGDGDMWIGEHVNMYVWYYIVM